MRYFNISEKGFKTEESENKYLWKTWDGQGKLRHKAVLNDCQNPARFSSKISFSTQVRSQRPKENKKNSSQILEDHYQVKELKDQESRRNLLGFFKRENKPVFDGFEMKPSDTNVSHVLEI